MMRFIWGYPYGYPYGGSIWGFTEILWEWEWKFPSHGNPELHCTYQEHSSATFKQVSIIYIYTVVLCHATTGPLWP